jgi:hypothetical protein
MDLIKCTNSNLLSLIWFVLSFIVDNTSLLFYSEMTSAYTSDAGIIQPCQNDAPSKVKLVIHHQFPGIGLVSPVYAGEFAMCYPSPDQRVVVGSAMQAGFDIDPAREESIGVLMYKLQRKNIDEFNEDGTSSEETTYIQLVIIWKVYKSGRFYVYSFLLEHDKDCVLDRDNLMKLAKCYKLANIQYCPVEETWLMHDNTVLMTSVSVTREEECFKLEIALSETSIKDDTWRPQCIDLNRWVSIMILITMFTY